MNQRLIEVVAYTPEWALAFEDEANHIHRVLADVELRIHHIGSTAIPNIYAKPIIDILLEVSDVNQLDTMGSLFDELSYEQMGEFGIPGRRYFRKDNEQGVRTHHIHAFAFSSPEVVRHLAFRDYMIAHPQDAKAYSELKQVLAEQFPTDIDGYMDGKDEFIKEHQVKALEWQNNMPPTPSNAKGALIVLGIIVIGLIPEFGLISDIVNDTTIDRFSNSDWNFFYDFRSIKRIAMPSVLGFALAFFFKAKSFLFQLSILMSALTIDVLVGTSISATYSGWDTVLEDSATQGYLAANAAVELIVGFISLFLFNSLQAKTPGA